MNLLRKRAAMRAAMAAAALLAVTACSNVTGQDDMGAGSGTGMTGAGQAGTVGDPTSPAYFQQAIGDRVLFAVDQSTLGDEARAVLEQQAQW
ncbi:peptidoglycan-associated lipoprotein, partial [Cribrihabitans sp. XS_ASV171]